MKGLVLRQGRWQARITIPSDVREIIGRREFVKSLGVMSKAEAELKAMPLIHKWKSWIAEARSLPSANLERLRNEPVSERVRILETFKSDLERINPRYTEADLIEYLSEQAVIYQQIEHDTEANRAALAEILGIACNPSSHLEEYMSVKLGDVKERSRDEHLSILKKQLCKAFPLFDEEHYSRANVIGWWEQQLISAKSASTLRKYQSHIKAYVKWLIYKGYLTKPNYFDELEPITKRQLTRAKKEERQPFTDDDVIKLLHFADNQLTPLILFGAYTGCRIEELCQLTSDDVYSVNVDGISRRYINIPVSKTKKGENRKVPLHPRLEPLIPENGYLIDIRNGVNKYGERSGKALVL